MRVSSQSEPRCSAMTPFTNCHSARIAASILAPSRSDGYALSFCLSPERFSRVITVLSDDNGRWVSVNSDGEGPQEKRDSFYVVSPVNVDASHCAFVTSPLLLAGSPSSQEVFDFRIL